MERAVAGAGAGIGVRRLGVDGLEFEVFGAGVGVVLRRVGVDGLELERDVEVLELGFELAEGT